MLLTNNFLYDTMTAGCIDAKFNVFQHMQKICSLEIFFYPTWNMYNVITCLFIPPYDRACINAKFSVCKKYADPIRDIFLPNLVMHM